MIVAEQKVKLLDATSRPLDVIEDRARVAYQSQGKHSMLGYGEFVENLIRKGHTSCLEFVTVAFDITTDRGISHELVRHRLASYIQESTRYCAYRKELSFVPPMTLEQGTEEWDEWVEYCCGAEDYYHKLLSSGMRAQNARDVLPTCLKTNIVMQMNGRELRHFYQLRSSNAAHPKMQQLVNMMSVELLRFDHGYSTLLHYDGV